MKKAYFILCFIIIVFVTNVLGRDNSVERCKCSKIIKKISGQWKADSLAGNGFRKSVVKELLNCSLNNIDVEFLIKYLGNPTVKKQYSDGRVSYRYYYYDYKYIDTLKNKAAGYGYDFINFNTDSGYYKISGITKGTGEY